MLGGVGDGGWRSSCAGLSTDTMTRPLSVDPRFVPPTPPGPQSPELIALITSPRNYLTQVDKLVQLLESPVFVLLRLQLLDAAQTFQPALLKSLYGASRGRVGVAHAPGRTWMAYTGTCMYTYPNH